MSQNNYSEYQPTDEEITEFLDELYPQDVIVCGMPMSQSYILRELDRIAFDMTFDNEQMYRCDDCDTVYRGEDAEDQAMECCQEDELSEDEE